MVIFNMKKTRWFPFISSIPYALLYFVVMLIGTIFVWVFIMIRYIIIPIIIFIYNHIIYPVFRFIKKYLLR